MMERQLQRSESSISSQVVETITEFSWDDCWDSHDDASIPTNSLASGKIIPTPSPLPGILRNPSIATRFPSPTSSTTAADISNQALWKCVLLVLVPMVGYTLSQLYPSSVLLHCTFLCFVYGMVDLMEHDPVLSITALPLLQVVRSSSSSSDANRSSNTFGRIIATTTLPPTTIIGTTSIPPELKRRRRVDFAKGTKFYRLPKPQTRRQRQAHRLCEQQEYTGRTTDNLSPVISYTTDMTTSTTTCTTFPTSIIGPKLSPSTAIIDWETTNRLLKKAISEHDRSPPQPQLMQKDDGVIKFTWQKSLQELVEVVSILIL